MLCCTSYILWPPPCTKVGIYFCMYVFLKLECSFFLLLRQGLEKKKVRPAHRSVHLNYVATTHRSIRQTFPGPDFFRAPRTSPPSLIQTLLSGQNPLQTRPMAKMRNSYQGHFSTWATFPPSPSLLSLTNLRGSPVLYTLVWQVVERWQVSWAFPTFFHPTTGFTTSSYIAVTPSSKVTQDRCLSKNEGM